MSTEAARRTIALTTATTDLEWFQIPHTLDQIIGIYAEATAHTPRPLRHGLSNEEILASLNRQAQGYGTKGGHSDPTPNAALAGEPEARDDTDETLRSIDAALELIAGTTHELAQTCATALDQPSPAGVFWSGRQGTITATITALGHLRPHLEDAINTMRPAAQSHIDMLIRTSLAETTTWLRIKATDIWNASRGEHRTVAIQHQITECTNCRSHGITGTIAMSSGLCANCQRFQADEKCLPDQRICRAWDRGAKSIPNGWKIEAKAASHRSIKPRRHQAS